MFIKLLKTAILTVAMLGLCSCGDSTVAGGEFATVKATARIFDSAQSTQYLTASSTAPVNIDYNITSEAYTSGNTGSTSTISPKNLDIDSIYVDLSLGNSSTPSLLSLQVQHPASSSPAIIVGSNKVTVEVINSAILNYLKANVPVGQTGVYYGTVSFHLVESGTLKAGTITALGNIVIYFSNL
jgi:hypothetical protein